MNRKIITSLLLLSHMLIFYCFAEEWFSENSEKDFKYVNMFIENISEANYVVILGDQHNTPGQLYDSRFRLESEDQKQAFQSFMTKLAIQEAECPSPSHPAFQGQIHYVEYDIDIVSVFDDHRESLSFSGPPLMAYLSSKQSFWIKSKTFDKDELYKFLKGVGVKYDTIKYTGNPPQYMPSIILGAWHTENNEVEIEFLDDGSFRIRKSPMNFCTHLNKIPDKYKRFHLIGETGKWTINDDLLSLFLTMAPPLDNGLTSIWISKLDEEHLDFGGSDSPTLRFVRSKNKSNQRVDFTVKTPVDEVKVMRTESHP